MTVCQPANQPRKTTADNIIERTGQHSWEEASLKNWDVAVGCNPGKWKQEEAWPQHSLASALAKAITGGGAHTSVPEVAMQQVSAPSRLVGEGRGQSSPLSSPALGILGSLWPQSMRNAKGLEAATSHPKVCRKGTAQIKSVCNPEKLPG